MIKIGICDDEKIFLDKILEMVQKYLSEKNIKADIDTFTDGKSLVEGYREYDILFLDIEMPILDGMETAKRIREMNSQTLIIFVTSSQEMVYKAFEVKTFRYLVKPIEYNELMIVLDAAIEELNKIGDETITVEITQRKYIKILVSEIIYIEKIRRKIIIHTKEKSYESNINIRDIEILLMEKNFYRTYTSYLVNMECIKDYDKNSVILRNGEIVMLSRLKYQDFKNTFMKFLKL